MFNDIINVYCDSRESWIEFNEKFKTEFGRDDLLQPTLNFIFENVKFVLYADFTNTNLPFKVESLLLDGCRPDLIFYSTKLKNIILLIEDTKTAPVGNAQKQRLPRPTIAYLQKIPFIYLSSFNGVDQSQKKERTITGVFKEIALKNEKSFITRDNYDLNVIIQEIVNEDIEKYIIKNYVNLNDTLKKTKIRIKDVNTNFFVNLKRIINYDFNVVNVFEKNGNYYIVKKNSEVAKFLNIEDDFYLILGKAWKDDGNYSDPFVGGGFSFCLLNDNSENRKKVVVFSSHNYNTKKLLNNNSKIFLMLEKCDILIDIHGEKFDLSKIKHDKKEIFEYKKDSESLSTYFKHKELIESGENVIFCQYPHGSWGSNDGLNNNKRDEKRPDLIIEGKPKGIESKEKLSDVYSHLKQYGNMHDEYVYINENCEFKEEYSHIKIRKVTE
jgi:hypothetical protein